MFCASCGHQLELAAEACAGCGGSAKAQPVVPERLSKASRDAFGAVKRFVIDPVGALGAAYEGLGERGALDVGIVLAVVADFGTVIGTTMAVKRSIGFFSQFTPAGGDAGGFVLFLKELLLGAVPIACLAVTLVVIQATARNGLRGLSRAVFIGGAVAVPFALLTFLVGLVGVANFEVVAILSVFALCYTILILFTGCRDILRLSPSAAAMCVPSILLVTAWLTKIIIVAAL
jgi:hypothetical protein